MGGGGNTELLGDIDVAAPGAPSDIARATNQGFEDLVAGLAMVFVDRHKEESSPAGRSVRVGYYPGSKEGHIPPLVKCTI